MLFFLLLENFLLISIRENGTHSLKTQHRMFFQLFVSFMYQWMKEGQTIFKN